MLTDNILQLHPLQVVPDALIRVQLGSIGGQLLQRGSRPSRAGQEGFDRLAAVEGAAIPDEQQPHRDVGGPLLQEPRRIYTPEGPVLDPSVQPAMGGDATDYQQMVPAQWYPEHWSLAPGRIGLDHQGQQVATRFVHEDDGPAFVPGLFGARASASLSSAGWLLRPAVARDGWASGGSTHTAEDAAHLGRVVFDPEVASDDLGYSGLGPDVTTKAQGRWPLGQ